MGASAAAEAVGLRQAKHRSREQHQGSQIGKHHQPVEDVGGHPDLREISGGGQHQHCCPDQPVDAVAAAAEQVFQAALAVVGEHDHGGEAEQHRNQIKDPGRARQSPVEGTDDHWESRLPGLVAFAAEHQECGHRGDQGRDQVAQDRNQSLHHRIAGACQGVHDRRGAHARFLGGDCPMHGDRDHQQQAPPHQGLAAEDIVDDGAQHLGQGLKVREQDQAGETQVSRHHQRHQHNADPADAAHPSLDHHKDDGSQQNSAEQPGQAQRVFKRVGQLAGLDAIAQTKAGEAGDACETKPQPAQRLGQPFAHHIHGTAHQFAPVVGAAKAHRQHHFAVLGGQAHQRDHPHPEKAARPADAQHHGDAGQAAGAHVAAQGGHQGGKDRERALAFASVQRAPGLVQGKTQLAQRQKAEPEGQEQADKGDPINDQSPEEIAGLV